MAEKVKMLFSNAPPDALENLLSSRRKLLYGLFAFGPGTILGLYLYSVKKRMQRENGVMRREMVESELNDVQERYDKDLVLANAVQEIRDRLRRLEEEAIVSRQNTATVATAASSKADKVKMQPRKEMSPPSESKIEVALAVLKSNEKSDEQKAGALLSRPTSSVGGSQGRRDQRHQERLQQDVAAQIAKQKE